MISTDHPKIYPCVSDVISHLPVLCEESKVPYVFVPARADLGAAIGSNTYVYCVGIVYMCVRVCVCVMIVCVCVWVPSMCACVRVCVSWLYVCVSTECVCMCVRSCVLWFLCVKCVCLCLFLYRYVLCVSAWVYWENYMLRPSKTNPTCCYFAPNDFKSLWTVSGGGAGHFLPDVVAKIYPGISNIWTKWQC